MVRKWFTWSFCSTGYQSTQPEDNGAFIFLYYLKQSNILMLHTEYNYFISIHCSDTHKYYLETDKEREGKRTDYNRPRQSSQYGPAESSVGRLRIVSCNNHRQSSENEFVLILYSPHIMSVLSGILCNVSTTILRTQLEAGR